MFGRRVYHGVTGRLTIAGVSLCALTATGALSSTAEAQEKPASDAGALQEVTVSARYTQENLQTTPLAITAVSGAELENRAIPNVATLGAVVPNLYTHVGDAVQGPTPTISMRGVTAGDYSFARDPAVGIYVDDVYHSTLVGSNLDLGDIERIEVRRGPQGTLAGNASIAGTVSIFSKQPKGDGSGYFEAAYGSFDRVRVKGAYDAAVTDNLFVRVSGQTDRKDGYVDQLDFTCEMNRLGTPELAGSFPSADRSAPQRDCKMGTFGGINDTSAKAVMRYVASDRLEFSATTSYYRADDEAPAELLVDAHPAQNDGFNSVYNAKVLAAYGIQYDNRFLPPPGRRYSAYATFDRPLEGIAFDNSQGQFSRDSSFKVDYDVTDQMHLKTIFGYSHNGGHLHQAGDVSPLGYVQGQVFFDTVQYTGEARLTGTSFGDKLDWAAGLFYLKSRNNLRGDIDFITINFTEDDLFHTETKSAFVHGNYHLTDHLSVSAGLRFARTEKDASLNHPPLFDRTIPFSVGANRTDWLISANYQFTDQVMGYASVATGSRPAGITTIVNTIYQLSEYPAEELTAYETGFKTEFFNRRMRTNVALFYSDYSKRLTSQAGFQCLGEPPPPTRRLSAADCPPGGAIGWSITIGTPAKVRGVELETTVEPIDRLLFSLSGGYNHFINGVKTPGQPGYMVKGNLPQPEWNGNAGIQYAIPLGNGTLTPRLDAFYTSRQTFTFSPSIQAPSGPRDIVPAHTIFNAQINYDFGEKGWQATLAATNLFDKYYFYTLFSGSTVATAGVIAPPREVSLSLRKTF
ncbi:MAG TPA: TonB-dependent receptor [Steroidobacteraceae bacterium]|nr:TonB-dependent receptor [Steroidobacteraceae bacterium]